MIAVGVLDFVLDPDTAPAVAHICGAAGGCHRRAPAGEPAPHLIDLRLLGGLDLGGESLTSALLTRVEAKANSMACS
jgi:hypothetical protein